MHASEAYRRAALGDFVEVERAIAALASRPEDAAWSTALGALFAMTVAGRGALPDAGSLPATPPPPDGQPWALVARQGVLSSLLAFDPRRLRAYADALRRIAGSVPCAGSYAAVANAEGWLAILEGRPRAPVEPRLVADGAASWDPALAIEESVQAALEAPAHDARNALDAARRASRKAAAEAILQSEYLANLVLARARRLVGTPHLALRILTSLGAVVPPAWRAWIGWELTLAGAPEGGPLAPFLVSVAAGAMDEATRQADAALDAISGFAPLAREARGYVDLVLPLDAPSADVADWVFGRTHPIPFGLRDPTADPLSIALAVGAPGRRSRRLFACGLSLLSRGGDVRIATAAARRRRTHEAVAVLAFAAPRG